MAVTLDSLRPKDGTAAGLRTALRAIAAERTDAMARVDGLQAKWQQLVRTGTVKELTATEGEIRTLQLWLDQIAFLESTIEPDLPGAVGREVLERVRAAVADAKTAAAAFDAWAQLNYPPLLAALRTGMDLELHALELRRIAVDMLRPMVGSAEIHAAGGVDRTLFDGFPDSLGKFTSRTMLPGLNNAERAP